MCIRDSTGLLSGILFVYLRRYARGKIEDKEMIEKMTTSPVCLLYTSDAADERSSVDLGGRRIIKKKTKAKNIS